MSARRIRFGGREHQQREIYAVHVHFTSDQLAYYGDGRVVMLVGKGPRVACVDVIGEDGEDMWGEPFVYTHYFHPEELTA